MSSVNEGNEIDTFSIYLNVFGIFTYQCQNMKFPKKKLLKFGRRASTLVSSDKLNENMTIFPKHILEHEKAISGGAQQN